MLKITFADPTTSSIFHIRKPGSFLSEPISIDFIRNFDNYYYVVIKEKEYECNLIKRRM